MSLNESNHPESRERWPVWMDIQGVPRDHRVREALMQEYREQGEQEMPVNHFTVGNSFDPSAKTQKPYVFQPYPKMLYSEQYDPAVEKMRSRIAAHNKTLRDPLQCRELPERKRLHVTVMDAAEENAAKAKGFVEKPFPAETIVEDDPFSQAFTQADSGVPESQPARRKTKDKN